MVSLEGKIYSCKYCGTHLALSDDIVSKVFLIYFYHFKFKDELNRSILSLDIPLLFLAWKNLFLSFELPFVVFFFSYIVTVCLFIGCFLTRLRSNVAFVMNYRRVLCEFVTCW